MKANNLRKEIPNKDSAPEECEYRECTHESEYWILFTRPKEYVCYCGKHEQEMYNSMNNTVKMGPLL